MLALCPFRGVNLLSVSTEENCSDFKVKAPLLFHIAVTLRRLCLLDLTIMTKSFSPEAKHGIFT